MEKLQTLLVQLLPGRIDSTSEIEDVLASCWEDLAGDAAGGMEGYKLKGRMESAVWTPPLLEFTIERHGALAFGSVYAGVQYWFVNIETGVASLEGERRRQVGRKDTQLKVKPLVAEISAAILAHANDPRLKWTGENKVRIDIVSVIPTTNEQTTSGRRKRFWNALEEKVKPHGWARGSSRSSVLQKSA
jgi:hypothetical protein